jgi:hypothetical protein
MNDAKIAAVVVGRTIGLFSEDVRNCLQLSGVVLDSKNYSDSQLLEATFNGLETSPKFLKMFSELVDLKQLEFGYLNLDSKEYSFSGEGSFFNVEGAFSTPFSTTPVTFGTSTPAAASTTSSWSAGNIISGASTAINLFSSIYGGSQASKNAQADRDAQIKLANIQMEIAKLGAGTEKDKLIAQQNMMAAQLSSGGNNNLPLYIGLGISGVVVLGLVVFLIVRGKGNSQVSQIN